jgi:hypothetical protein
LPSDKLRIAPKNVVTRRRIVNPGSRWCDQHRSGHLPLEARLGGTAAGHARQGEVIMRVAPQVVLFDSIARDWRARHVIRTAA